MYIQLSHCETWDIWWEESWWYPVKGLATMVVVLSYMKLLIWRDVRLAYYPATGINKNDHQVRSDNLSIEFFKSNATLDAQNLHSLTMCLYIGEGWIDAEAPEETTWERLHESIGGCTNFVFEVCYRFLHRYISFNRCVHQMSSQIHRHIFWFAVELPF